MTPHTEDAMTREQALEALTSLLAITGKLSSAGGENLTLRNARYELKRWGEKYNDSLERALASAKQEPAPSADAEEADLTERCKEIIDWKDTGTLKGEALRNFAKRQQEIGIPEYHALPVAESKTAREAMEFVISAALLRYAGDGVTDAGVRSIFQVSPIEGPMVGLWIDVSKETYDASDRSETYDRRIVYAPAARAKPSEKGGAR